MITHVKKIKLIEKSKPKITLKKVFQGYKTSPQKNKKIKPSKNKNKKKNKSNY